MDFGEAFRAAVGEYRWLLDRGYPGGASLKLVGDRRRLSAEERLVVFRGVASSADSETRRARLAVSAEGRLILLDAYNAAFTVVHYLVGKPCFLSTDGLLRDAGANYGRVPREELLSRAFGELAQAAREAGAAAVEAWLDAPVSRSAAHAAALRAALEAAGLPSRVELARSADGAILARLREASGRGEAAAGGGQAPARTAVPPIVASSDSAIADQAPEVFDLARRLLAARYGAAFLDLGALAEVAL